MGLGELIRDREELNLRSGVISFDVLHVWYARNGSCQFGWL